jgi:protein TonB
MRRCLALLAALLLQGSPAPAQEVAVAETPSVRFVDGAPRGPTVMERLAEIRRRIAASTVYPPLARLRGVEGEAVVRFDIEADGTPTRIRVHRSSGKPSLDRAASAAVRDAAPLPWVYGRLEVPVRFALDGRR